MRSLLLLGFICLSACQMETTPHDPMDDYVLIEFASKLEADYEKLYPPPPEPDPSKTNGP